MAQWHRDVWLDAVMTSALKPLERLIAVVYSRRAGPNDVVWVGASDLIDDSGLSRNAARNALRGLVAAGWLELVERERQQRAARYRMVVPVAQGVISAPPEGVTYEPSQGVMSGPSETEGGHERTPSGGHEKTPGGHLVTPAGHLVTPYLEELQQPSPTTRADALWMVVVDALPPELAQTVTRTRQLDDVLNRFLFDGWTPDLLDKAARARSWNGCRAGAVAFWLTNLGAPMPSQARASRPTWCGECDETSRRHEHQDGSDAGRCPTCHPDPLRLAS